MTGQRSIGASVGVGLLVGIVLWAFISVVAWNEPTGKPYWQPIPEQLENALTTILPGLIAGYLAQRAGFLVGASAGIFTSLVVSVVTTTVHWPPYWEAKEVTPFVISEAFAYALAAFITNGVAGVAGVHLAPRKNAFFSSSGRESA